LDPVFDPEVDCPAKLVETRAMMCCPIRAAQAIPVDLRVEGSHIEWQRDRELCGAISVIYDTSSSKRFTEGDVRVLELLAGHITSLIYCGQYKPGISVLFPHYEDVEAQMLRMANNDSAFNIDTTDGIFEKMKQLTMQLGIKTASRDLIWEHVKRAEKSTTDWRLKDLLTWFNDTKEASYPAYDQWLAAHKVTAAEAKRLKEEEELGLRTDYTLAR